MKRGPYKKWLCSENGEVPRQTLRSRQQLDKNSLIDDISPIRADEVIYSSNRSSSEIEIYHGASIANCNTSNPCSQSQMNLCNDDEEEMENEILDDVIDEEIMNSSHDEFISLTIMNEDDQNGNDVIKNKKTLYKGCRLNEEEAELLILAYSLRHNINDEGLEDLLHLINCFLPAHVFTSRYHFLKKYDNTSAQVMKKYYCCVCQLMLDDEYFACSSCQRQYKRAELDQHYQYFLYIPIKNHLIDFIHSPLYSARTPAKGAFFQDLLNRGTVSPNDLSLQVNTDGVSPLKSSTRALWPIQVMINELPYTVRKKYMFLCGLWYNEEKPPMNLYFKMFVDEMNELEEHGIDRCVPGEPDINVKVRVALFTVDSVARPLLQQINQFNGQYGCSFCLHPGEVVEVGNGHTRVYLGGTCAAPRNLKQHFRDCKLALSTGTAVNGVKGPTILNSLPPPFDITKCFSTDYLHNHLLGVTKLFLEAWFNSANHEAIWYLGQQADLFDCILTGIRPPIEVTRCPRSIKDRKHWKASEYKHFLLYYSSACLLACDCLPRKYLEHWSLLVYSTYIFLKSNFTAEEFESASVALQQFVTNIENLYDITFYKFNVHLLLHVPEIVALFGPLWSTSGFPFEHYNGILSQMFFNSLFVPLQICKRYLRYKNADWKSMYSEDCPKDAKDLYNKLSQRRNFGIIQVHDHASNHHEAGKLVLGREFKVIQLTTISKVCIENEVMEEITPEARTYRKCTLRGMSLHSENCGILQKRCNSVVQLLSGDFVIVNNIFMVSGIVSRRNYVMLEVEQLQIVKRIPLIDRFLSVPVSKTGNVTAMHPTKVAQKAVLVPWGHQRHVANEEIFFVIPLVNSFERD